MLNFVILFRLLYLPQITTISLYYLLIFFPLPQWNVLICDLVLPKCNAMSSAADTRTRSHT